MLVDGTAVVYESAIINEYLEEKYPEIALMPRSLSEKKLMEESISVPRKLAPDIGR